MNYLTEEIKNKALELLDESLGAFNEQYKIAEYISDIAFDMLLKNINKNVVDIEDDSIIKQVDITLNLHAISIGIKAQLENIDDNGKAFILITFPENIQFNKSKDYIIGQLTSIISHELMHANVILNRFNNNEEINDMPSYYPNVLAIIQNEDENSDIYAIGYGLYSTYYQEVQAFVSQTSSDIRKLYGGKLTYTSDEIKEGLKHSDAYMVYSNNIHGKLNNILEYSDECIEDTILPYLERYELTFTAKELRKEIKKIINVSKKAIHNIYRNAMLLMIKPEANL